ncbi:MAG: hypothetical protein NTX61_16480 [Bacteroidetes bacterium]|nr:hypothetical protein [Bacteroidota bacterium]
MKAKINIISLLLMFCIVAWITPQKATAQGGSVSFQVFYDELSPYGTWVDNPDYGYVWVPNVAPGFSPYATNGYWVFTDDGWTWVSNYSWGWAPFHYGRWYTDPTYGPMWVPDNEWGPGWVTWRRSSNYYGWAPMGPGISVSVAYGEGYNEHYNQYTFVRGGYMGRTNINNYYVNNSNNVTIINNSTVINNTRVDRTRNVTYNAGPDRGEVEKRVGKPITPVAIRESSKPGQNLSKNQLQIYRPQVQRNVTSGSKPAPLKVENLKNVKPAAQRTVETPVQKANQTVKQPSQPKPGTQPVRQPSQPKQGTQPVKQPSQPKQGTQPVKQPSQPKQGTQPVKQPSQPQRTVQPDKKQPQQPQKTVQPPKQQPQQPQRTVQPPKQKPAQPQKTEPPKKAEDVKQPQKDNPPKKVEGEKELQQPVPPKFFRE